MNNPNGTIKGVRVLFTLSKDFWNLVLVSSSETLKDNSGDLIFLTAFGSCFSIASAALSNPDLIPVTSTIFPSIITESTTLSVSFPKSITLLAASFKEVSIVLDIFCHSGTESFTVLVVFPKVLSRSFCFSFNFLVISANSLLPMAAFFCSSFSSLMSASKVSIVTDALANPSFNLSIESPDPFVDFASPLNSIPVSLLIFLISLIDSPAA